MKLKDFLSDIKMMVEKNSELLEADVIYSIDDEGNAFHKLHFPPSTGIYTNGEFDSDNVSDDKINAICIN